MGIEEFLAEEARQEEREQLVENLLRQTELSSRKIASVANVSEYIVRKIRGTVKKVPGTVVS